MLCGLTHIASRIKHMLFFSFSKKYRPFEHLKCHECLWCKFFDDCKKEYDYALELDAVSDSFHNGETHAKHMPYNPVDLNAAFDYMDKHNL